MTLNKGGCNSTVVVVALLVSRVITTSGDFAVVVVVIVTGTVDALVAVAFGVLSKSVVRPDGGTLFVRNFFFGLGSCVRVNSLPLVVVS